MTRLLFGPRGSGSSSTRQVELRGVGTLEVFKKAPPAFSVVQRLLATMDHRDAVDLTELAGRYGPDKWGVHQYTEHYQRHFKPLRDRPLTVLEIGIGGFADPELGGNSLRMWKRYFPRAVVYGVDIHDKSPHNEQRIHTVRADQSDPASLEDLVRHTGPLDIIIDDGSHVSDHVLTSFHALFPHLRTGGTYVIEDLQTSYWPRFGGSSENLDSPATSMGFLKTLVDGLNHEEIIDRSPARFDGEIRGLSFYHNLVFIEKGANTEGGGPDWARYGLPG